jgi:hypothetical protein
MLEFVRAKVSERKLRLFACSCCRRVERVLKDDVIRKALDAAERYADGRIRESTLSRWHRQAVAARNDLSRLHYSGPPPWAAYQAVADASLSEKNFSYVHALIACNHVALTVALLTGHTWDHPIATDAAQAESAALSDLLRDIVGNPFRPPPSIDPGWLQWQHGMVGRLASGIYDERRFAELPILADALEDAGCTDAVILRHCRSGGEHARGCWLVDLLLNMG